MGRSHTAVTDGVRGGVLAAVILVLLAAPAAAQQADGPRDVYNEQLRVALDEQLPEAREMGFDAGGWFNFAFFNYDDGPGSTERTLRHFQVRGWARMNLQGVHQAFFRGLLNYEDWNSGDNPSNNRGDDYDELVERAWYQFDLGKLHRVRTGERLPIDFRVRVGRDFTTVGTALVMSMPIDKIQFEVETANWDFMTFLGQSIRNSRNLDTSDNVAGRDERCFWAAQVTYKGFDEHRPFGYVLVNEDQIETRQSVSQWFGYNSVYLGGGSTGTLILPRLRYVLEAVSEWGRNYGNGATASRDSIKAYALDAQLEYLSQAPMRPRFTLEYLLASGDNDRFSSSTATVGGNTRGSTDGAFNAFGFRDTGIAFGPSISNLHMYALGAGFRPLEKIDLFKRMELGTRVFLFHKAAGEGPISDGSAVNDAAYLGWEWDIYCDWRITSDLAWTVRYGVFQPGAAFKGGEADTRHFLYTGMLLSF